MYAAVLNQLGQTPCYAPLAKPEVQTAEQQLIRVEAASIKQLDKLKVSGRHYTAYNQFPCAVGVDGVGRLADGRRVYAMGITGMMAEYALVNTADCVQVPEGLSPELAAILPNALLGSDAALLCRGQMQTGQVVLINGATGVSGRMAVQAAKYRGASRIIVTGRNPESLAYLQQLGADVIISLCASPTEILRQLTLVQQETPIEQIIDYLWGAPTEYLLQVLAKHCPKPVNLITIGQMAGVELNLPSSYLRSQPICLLGSGIGSISAQQLRAYQQQELPQLFAQAAEGLFQAEYQCYPLSAVAQAWQAETAPGARIVLTV